MKRTMMSVMRWVAPALLSAACSAFAQDATDAWRKALASTYGESEVRDAGDGITTSVACFESVPKGQRCKKLAFMRHDAFQKVRFFTPPKTRLSQYGSPNYLRSEVGALDCEKPIYILRPYYFSKQGWLSMQRVSVLQDGQLAFDRKLDSRDIRRDDASYGMEEKTFIVASDTEIQALRQIAKGGKIAIRLAGDGSYAPIPKRLTEQFSQDVADALAIYDALTAAISPQLLQACQAAIKGTDKAAQKLDASGLKSPM